MTNTIKLWLYPGADPTTTPFYWQPYEVDISQYVRRPGQDGGSRIAYQWGKQNESTQTDYGTMSLTLDNRDGRFSTDKADGPYYGLIDTNTPIRLGVGVGSDSFTRTIAAQAGAANGWAGVWTSNVATTQYSVDGAKALISIAAANSFSVPQASGFDCRDMDTTVTIYPMQTATGAAYSAGVYFRYTDNSNYDVALLQFNTAGNVSVRIRQVLAGVLTDKILIDPVPSTSYSAGVAWKMRVQADASAIRLKVWPAASSEPTSWTTSAIESDNTGTAMGLFANRLTGNTNTGNQVGFDDFTVTAIEWSGFVNSWPLEWDITGNNSWAHIGASGVLNRLRQGTNPIKSPLTRQLSGTSGVVAYWPMEEGSVATFFGNTVANGRPGTFAAVTPGADSSLAGATQSPTLNTDQSRIHLPVAPGVNSGGTGFSAMFLFKLPSLPSTKTRIGTVSPRSGPVATYAFSVDSANTYIEALNTAGTVINSVTNVSAEDFTKWTAWQVETDNSVGGGNTGVSAIYHAVGKTTYWAQTMTIAGTTLSNIGGMDLTGPAGTAFAHAWLGNNTLPFVTNSFSLVSSGYAGESPSDRFERVCGEAGIQCTIFGNGLASTDAMGPQKEGSTMAILQSCVDVDYGAMIEAGFGLAFVPKKWRFNAAQTYSFSKAAGEIGSVPKPVRDDQRLKNQWTISQVDGGSATYTDPDSVSRSGVWEDSATLNTYTDSNLDSQASWRVHIGTSQRLRWPSAPLNFARSPQLAVVWRKRQYGWRFGMSTGLLQVTGNEPDLIMEGFQANLDPDVWDVEMNCTSADTWQVGKLDTNKYDAHYTTLGGALAPTDTTLILSMSSVYEKWRTGASTVHILVSGEEIALGTVGAITGSGPWTQTVTGCTRAVNGVSKSQKAGAPVSVKNALTLTL